MKKFGISLFFVFFGLSVFAQSAGNGTITEMSGTIELKFSKDSGYIPAKVGDIVAQDTIISSSFKSTAVIKVGSSTIVVQPITMLTLAEIGLNQGAETVNVNLRAGRVQVDVKPPSGTKASFTVITPTATASVRGTSFDMDTRNIRVTNGVVRYAARRAGGSAAESGGEGGEESAVAAEGAAGSEGAVADGSAGAGGTGAAGGESGGGSAIAAGSAVGAGGTAGAGSIGGRNIYAGGESMINERKSRPYHPVEVKETTLQPKSIQGTESRPEKIEPAAVDTPLSSDYGFGFNFTP